MPVEIVTKISSKRQKLNTSSKQHINAKTKINGHDSVQYFCVVMLDDESSKLFYIV